ncbi:MAG: hypothetical protein LCH69_06305 [Proteobacteria bacterium]|nr:hypothetical protein [Pseudomonadota bacterium]
MKLSTNIFSSVFKSVPRYTQVSPRLFANGWELDPETAIIVVGLPPYLLKDIGVTDREDQGNRMDKRLHA